MQPLDKMAKLAETSRGLFGRIKLLLKQLTAIGDLAFIKCINEKKDSRVYCCHGLEDS